MSIILVLKQIKKLSLTTQLEQQNKYLCSILPSKTSLIRGFDIAIKLSDLFDDNF